jgi:hypothetical protein
VTFEKLKFDKNLPVFSMTSHFSPSCHSPRNSLQPYLPSFCSFLEENPTTTTNIKPLSFPLHSFTWTDGLHQDFAGMRRALITQSAQEVHIKTYEQFRA